VWQFDCQALYQGSPAATEDQGQTGLAQASILQPGKQSRTTSWPKLHGCLSQRRSATGKGEQIIHGIVAKKAWIASPDHT